MQDKATDSDRRAFLAGATAAAAALGLPAAQAQVGTRTVAQADAITMAAQMRKGDITPLEALDAAIARVEALPKLNAVVIKDYELAREHAKKLSTMGRDARKQATDKAPLWVCRLCSRTWV